MKSKLVIGLRGLARGNRHWGDFPDILQKENAEITFLPIEMPGNGVRWEEASLTNVFDVIADLRKNISSNEKIILVGISLGGMIALKWAELFPDEIDQVFVINSSLKQLSPFYHRLRFKNYLKILSLLFMRSTEREEAILKITSHQTSSRFNQDFKILNFFRQMRLATQIKIEKLSHRPIVICSYQDQLVSWSCSKQIAKKFEGELIIHESAGHDLPLDEPQWLVQQVATKIKQQGGNI